MIIPLESIPPGGKRPQSRLAPPGGANVHYSRESAPQHRRKIRDALAEPWRNPGRVSVAPVVQPLWLSPLVSGCWKDDRLPGTVAELAVHAQRGGIVLV